MGNGNGGTQIKQITNNNLFSESPKRNRNVGSAATSNGKSGGDFFAEEDKSDDSSRKKFFDQALMMKVPKSPIPGSLTTGVMILSSKVEDHFKNSNLNYVMRRSTYRH